MKYAPIVKLCYGQKELAIRIVQPGCSGGQLVEYKNIQLVIKAPYCNRLMKSPLIVCGCWPGYPENIGTCGKPPHEHPTLVYPAFETSDEGDTVFRLDDKIFMLPSGRYIGTIEFKDGTIITSIDIDLCNDPFLIDRVTVKSKICNGDTC